MRIEVLVGSDDPLIFPLNSTKMTLGSGETCDICVNADGISRKHLIIISEDDQYYVIDQGSTNGSFINEGRLIPGRKVEFTSFFPVRLGDNVLVSLISDEEADELASEPLEGRIKERSFPEIKAKPPMAEDSTTVISLSSLKSANTEKLVLQRQEKRKQVKQRKKTPATPPKKKSKPINWTAWFTVLLFASAAYYNLYVMEPEVPEEVSQMGEIVKVEETRPVIEKPVFLLAKDQLTPLEALKTMTQELKCVTDLEKYLCQSIAGADKQPTWGVTQVRLMLNVMVDGSTYIEKAKALIPPPIGDAPEILAAYEKQLKIAASMIFFQHGIPKTLDYELLKETNLTFALYQQDNDKVEVFSAIGATPKGLMELKKNFNETMLTAFRFPDSDVGRFAQTYVTLY